MAVSGDLTCNQLKPDIPVSYIGSPAFLCENSGDNKLTETLFYCFTLYHFAAIQEIPWWL